MKKPKILATLMALCMASSIFFACRPGEDIKPRVPGDQEVFYSSAVDREGNYTMTINGGRPKTLNGHQSRGSEDSDVRDFIEYGLFSRQWDVETLDSNNPTFKWVNDMSATEDPKDVTSSLTAAQKTKYGVPAGAKTGYAWEFELRDDLKWQDGTAINAQTYLDSMELLLNPKYYNFRAHEYFATTKYAPANGKYYANKGWISYSDILNGDWESNFDESFVDEFDDKTDYEEMYKDVAALKAILGDAYLSVTITKGSFWAVNYFGDDSIEDSINYYLDAKKAEDYDKDGLTVADGDRDDMNKVLVDTFNADFNLETYEWLKGLEDKQGYVNVSALTAAEQLKVEKFMKGYVSKTYPVYWFTSFSGGQDFEDKDFDEVGIYKTGDLKFVYVAETGLTLSDVKGGVDGWLVKPDLYVAGEEKVGDIWISKYGSSIQSVQAYGPYKLSVYSTLANTIEFVRNENWFGWNDSKYDNQYQTSHITMMISPTRDVIKQKFLKGEYDTLGLDASDYEDFKNSKYLVRQATMTTWALNFNSRVSDLIKIESTSAHAQNLVALSNAKFRKAISLSINRREIGSARIGSSPAFALLSSLFIYNIDNDPNSIYRNQREAREVIASTYDIPNYKNMSDDDLAEAVRDVTGYDPTEANKLFKEAFEELKSVEGFDPTKAVKANIYFPMSNELSTIASLFQTGQQIHNDVKDAAKNSGFAGVELNPVSSMNGTTVYDQFEDGEREILFGGFSGSNLNPFGFLSCYAGGNLDSVKNWSGVNTDDLTITADFDLDPKTANTSLTKKPVDWQIAIEKGDFAENQTDAGYHLRLVIATELEKWVASKGLVCPLFSDGGVVLYSARFIYVTTYQHPVLGFGSNVRWRRYSMNDQEWASYISSNGGDLTNIYK